jgi:predicted RNA polymerase sigma factor
VSIDPHFFRHESGRLVAALTRFFGVHNLELAEDVTQHAFCRALEVWKVQGIPAEPRAWLLATAKHRALDVLRRERTARRFAPELERELGNGASLGRMLDSAFTPEALRDEQLRMMFSCCHPALAADCQVALILNVLCGFGAPEIAAAFLSGRAAIEKRIARGKSALRAAKHLFELSDAQFEARLATVMRALYLLFNEGYHGASSGSAVRPELCDEALRLVGLLLGYAEARSPTLLALAALMHLDAARLPARRDGEGELVALSEQDRNRWDQQLLHDGITLFEASTAGSELSAYHVEAAIAVAHVSAQTFAEIDWNTIVSLYDRLMSVAPSPVVALNRAIAIAERDGPAAGLAALARLAGAERLANYPFLPAAWGELLLRDGRAEDAAAHFTSAIRLARSDAERRFLERRLAEASS